MKFLFFILCFLFSISLFAQDSTYVHGRFSNELWDMFWLINPSKRRGAPISEQSGRVVSFNIQNYSFITNASLEYDYFDGDLLIGETIQNTSFRVSIDGQIIDEVTGATNTTFVHRSVDITSFAQGKYSIPIYFESIPGGDGTVIARVHLVIESTVTSINNNKQITINKYELSDNYPNPFNPTTTIEYSIPKSGKVKLKIFNSLGQKVKTLINQEQFSGSHKLVWNGTNDNNTKLSSGTYFYQLYIDGKIIVKKMLLIK